MNELAKYETSLETWADINNHAIIAFQNKRVSYVSESFIKMIGCSSEEMIMFNESYITTIHPQYQDWFEGTLKKISENGSLKVVESKVIKLCMRKGEEVLTTEVSFKKTDLRGTETVFVQFVNVSDYSNRIDRLPISVIDVVGFESDADKCKDEWEIMTLLKKSKVHYDQLVECMSGEIVYMNLVAEDVFGSSSSPIYIFALVTEEDRYRMFSDYFKLFVERRDQKAVYKIQTITGESLPMEVRMTLSSDRFPFMVRSILSDASEVIESTTEKQKHLEMLVHIAPFPVVMFDQSKNVTLANRSFGEITNMTVKDIMGRNIFGCFPDDHHEMLRDSFDLINEEVHTVRAKVGDFEWITSAVFQRGKPISFHSIGMDSLRNVLDRSSLKELIYTLNTSIQDLDSILGIYRVCDKDGVNCFQGSSSRDALKVVANKLRDAGKIIHRGTGEKILVVDDSVSTLLFVRHILEEAGYSVIRCEDSNFAEATYQEHQPDLVLCDIEFSSEMISGERVIEGILKLDPQARIMILSGVSGLEVLAAKFKVKGYIPKPIAKLDFLKMVWSALG